MFLGTFLSVTTSFLVGNCGPIQSCYSSSSSSSAFLLQQLDATSKTYEICVSPGCVADGADQLLSKMQALAPSDISVTPGDCCSLCGNGPIVLEGNKKYRKVSDVKLVELLFGEEGMTSKQQAVFDAFNIVVEAGDFLKQKNYAKAVELYEEGIGMGLEPALSSLENTANPSDNDDDAPSDALQWLVNARQDEATAKLNLGDMDGAIDSAKSACDLSNQSSLPALEILQEAYAKRTAGGSKDELEVLQAYFTLPEPEKMTTMQSNKRRNLGFRLQKLEREAK